MLTIEGADSANTNIHSAADTLATLDPDLAVEILHMNTAYLAAAAGMNGDLPMLPTNPPIQIPSLIPGLVPVDWWKLLRVSYSGRYSYNGGASARAGSDAPDPVFDIDEPIFTEQFVNPIGWLGPDFWRRPRFTLHIDIDDVDPLDVVSGDISAALVPVGVDPTHFIGRVTSNTQLALGGIWWSKTSALPGHQAATRLPDSRSA